MAYVTAAEPADEIQQLLLERERLLHEQDQSRALLRELLQQECKRLGHDITFLRERIDAIRGDVPPVMETEASPDRSFGAQDYAPARGY